MSKDVKIPFGAPLQEPDTESQTFGCRQNNPEICKNNGLSEVCAFARKDHICKQPSRAWKKQYYKLMENADKNK